MRIKKSQKHKNTPEDIKPATELSGKHREAKVIKSTENLCRSWAQ